MRLNKGKLGKILGPRCFGTKKVRSVMLVGFKMHSTYGLLDLLWLHVEELGDKQGKVSEKNKDQRSSQCDRDRKSS